MKTFDEAIMRVDALAVAAEHTVKQQQAIEYEVTE